MDSVGGSQKDCTSPAAPVAAHSYDSRPMSRPLRAVVVAGAIVAAAALAACGTERISVPTSQSVLHRGAVLFTQSGSGCPTLSYAATQGSAANVFTAEFNNGPNFDVRCERPETRVLYAIENGGFSGAIMPQNIVVGKDAQDVARFVATYSGRQAPKLSGQTSCQKKKLGSIPPPPTSTTASAPATVSSSTASACRRSTLRSSTSTASSLTPSPTARCTTHRRFTVELFTSSINGPPARR